MSDCCTSTSPEYPSSHKHPCPASGKECGQVPITTIKHHIKAPWAWDHGEQVYYFCADPDCEVVYFAEDGSVIEKSALRTEVGAKEPSDQALVCYCFGVTRASARSDSRIRDFVVQETRQGHCACESRNPSGRCCLADFPKPH